MRIDHVQLAMPPGREADADHFYVTLLELERLEKPAALAGRGGRWYQVGDRQLHLGVEPGFVASAKAHVALVCDDYDALLARLEAAGCRVVPDDALEDVERFYTYDPFGNRLEVIRG